MVDAWMDVLSIKPLALGLLVPLVVYKLLSARKRSDGIPMVPYTLPWVGSALTVGKNPDVFFRQAEERLGPMFRVMLFGSADVFVVSPPLISAIYRDPKTFTFSPFRAEMSQYIFGISPFAAETSTFGEFAPMHHTQLSPKEAPKILRRFVTLLQKGLQDMIPVRVGPPEEQESMVSTMTIALQDLLLPVSFHAASKALFGSTLPSEEIYPHFVRFNKDWPLLAAQMPRLITRGAHKAYDSMTELLRRHLEGPHGDASELVHSAERIGKETGWSAEQTARVLGTTLWASETNIIWAIYWLIAASLTQPEGLRPLVAEIDASRSKYIKDHPEADILREILHDADANVDTDATCHWINSTSSADLPLLTATIQEVIRLYASGFSKRRVTQSTTLGGHVLEEGQDVLVVARSVHLDEDIHEDAAKWKPSRYLNTKSTDSTGSESLGGKKYRKDGKIVPNHSMPWGGGVSMCEGRHLAMGELKASAIMLLTMFEIEVDAGTTLPTMDTTRMGVGMFHATSDIDVHVKRRTMRT